MPLTYSINVGTQVESLKKQDINSALLDIPDNTQKMISPKDVRDAFLTSWSSSAFKQTIGNAGIEYIGVDSGNPSDRDIKQKIYIGKRNYAGLDIMNNYLLNDSNNDIYINNTKPDSSLTQSTTIVILSGTDSLLYEKAPYIESYVDDSETSLGLNIVNPSLYSGPINIYSETGRVSINNIIFPTIQETIASASNGKILKYRGSFPNGGLKWEDPNISISTIGSPETVTNIYGSPSNVNGYSLEFVDDNLVPKTLGGVEIGSSFSSGSFNNQNWPLSEVIRKILYPYVPPTLSLNVTNGTDFYFSTGLTQTSYFDYTIYRYSNIIYDYEISGTTYSGLSYSGNVGDSINQIFSKDLYSDTVGTSSYVLSARDNNNLLTFSHSFTSSVIFEHPSFYGFTTSNIPIDGTGYSQLGIFINQSNRFLFKNSNSVTLEYNGSGYMYFIIPFNYPLLSNIKDPNGFVIHSSSMSSYSTFTYSLVTTIPTGALNLPTPTPGYRIYKTNLVCNYNQGNFEFIF